METQSRFDLNNAVAAWRQELAAQTAISLEQARELETHLLDALPDLQQRGLTEEESFWLARRRLGKPEDIAADFAKGNPGAVWRERVFWIALGALTIHSGLAALNGLVFFVVQLIGLGESSTAFKVVFYFAGIAAVALALWQLSRSNEGAALGWLAKVFTTRTRVALCVGMVVLVSSLGAAVGFWQALVTSALYHQPTGVVIEVLISVFRTALMNLVLPVVLAIFIVRLAPLQSAKS